jgi:ribosomal protein L31E
MAEKEKPKKKKTEAVKETPKPKEPAPPQEKKQEKPVEKKPEAKKPEAPASKDNKQKEPAEPPRIYVIPLVKVFSGVRTMRAKHAMKLVREFLKHHMKTKDVKIDGSINERISSRGKTSIPRRITVSVKREGGVARAVLAE